MKTHDKIAVFVCAFFCLTYINAQNFEWVKAFGGTSYDYAQSVTTDAYGNIYTTGSFKGAVDFDPGAGIYNLNSTYNYNVFVQKLDANGNFLWAKAFGGTSGDYGYSITIDASGNVYTTGTFQGTVDFDPGAGTANLTSAGGNDIFVQKLDSNGSFIWAKSFEGAGYNDQGLASTLDLTGNIYTTGFFQGKVDFDPSIDTAYLTPVGSYDVFIQKMDPNGNFIWAKSFGGLYIDQGFSISTDSSGNVYSTGKFQGTVDFDPGIDTTLLAAVGGYDVFVQKLDSNGNFVWAKSFGGTADDQGHSINIDSSENVYTTGYFGGVADFNPGIDTTLLAAVGGYDVFIQKMDPNGNFIWAKSFGGAINDQGLASTLDVNGNIYTTGFFQGTADFDPNIDTTLLISVGGDDVFVQKLDSSGNLIWAKSFGGINNDQGLSINTYTPENVYTVGGFIGTANFNPGTGTTNLTSVGYQDVFIQKLSLCGNPSGTDIQTACNSYTWIDGNTYTSSNNTSTYTLTNINGCDSVVTLNLTINTADTSVSVIDAITLQANASGAVYQWLDCGNNYSALNGETNQSFTANNNGDYAIQVTENGCTDTSSCYVISSVGINENGNNQITIYPNPTQNEFTISLGNINSSAVQVIDLNGKIILNIPTLSNTVNVDMHNLDAGVYFVKVVSEKGNYVEKVVKQ